MASRIELSRRAVRDLRNLGGADLDRVRTALDRLAAAATNLDVKPLAGASPWLRLRAGDWRILFRPQGAGERGGYLVARIVNRRDLDRAVETL